MIMNQIIPILVGVAAGVASGIFGIGGGVIIVPALVFWMGLTQQQATVTSLAALILPVGILGVYAYWKAGDLPTSNIWTALLVAAGLTVGAYFGARVALVLPTQILTRAFAIFLVAVAIRMWLKAS